jgi:hypothetical protein
LVEEGIKPNVSDPQLHLLSFDFTALTRIIATLIGNLNRLGPALPGFKNNAPFLRVLDGSCE